MILTEADPPPYKDDPVEPGPSRPVSYQDHATGILVDIPEVHVPDGGELPPPEFTPYQAESFQTSDGCTVSHDGHLNTDGEALYRFLLSESTKHPVFQLHCSGSHSETRYRRVDHRESDGRIRTRTESFTETIQDFNFYIDASNLAGPIHWSVDDLEPAYRGAMVREVETSEGNCRTTKRSENKRFKAWVEDRTARGLPPWVGSGAAFAQGMSLDAPVLRSSKTLRQWADIYCASPKILKEFVYEKVVYGWNIRQLENAVRAVIVAAPYRGDITVEFITSANKVYVRPDNRLSRLLSNKWFKFLTIILLIFPFIWLFKRFHAQGGGTWSVCGGAYSLKSWAHEEPEPTDGSVSKTVASSSADPSPPSRRLVGTTEGAWFRRWQSTIGRAVVTRFQNSPSSAMYTTMEEDLPQAQLLDGY
uniref:Uncharacterized protein n=1 Tax=Mycena chlorophos TaxID=658473 RepID=A0ABQ0L174_MYCCL|nr:predicted protein [Mycena chlorophos]